MTLRHPSSHGTSNNIFTIKYLRIPIIANCNVLEFKKMFYINTNSFTQQFLKYCCVFPYFNVTVQKKTTWQTLRLFCMTVFSLQQRKWIRMVEHFRFWFHIAFCFPSGKKDVLPPETWHAILQLTKQSKHDPTVIQPSHNTWPYSSTISLKHCQS